MIQLSGAGKRFGHKLLFENTGLAHHGHATASDLSARTAPANLR